ncbi:bifunctional folylpolyglutamate synthase/dihydrofolate synthase [Candidatus Uabimicrobium amorphum]|uniref:Bifunctional folylpolyglutamatesynthase/dihydrofolate synthase n=1 Tax=Uabimicrobium amorphum TaxID=2596890 RepID=A0A5S9IN57_UABAM|nr:Mur ligase family protein [Candidatus Uabimicrobium amorphum]BBM84401.1 bifunctional folylpolyglutamatesynthase/dihydrofolate synthase [Candidatus Uabimicrobium amorphum]
MTSYVEALEHLNQTVELHEKWDLEKISQIIARPNATNIQIVGTNGKGTTALFLQKILCAHGFNVGLFTSPHLVNVTERIRYNANCISANEFGKVYMELRDIFDEKQLSYFEKLMVVAAEFFCRHPVDFVIWEAGLGGRLDATTAIKNDIVLFTPIAKDHSEYLGDTLEQIAYEKFFVSQYAKKVYSSPQSQIVQNFMQKQAEIYCKEIFFIPQVSNFYIAETGTVFDIDNQKITIPMLGKHYAQNAALAWNAAQQTLKQKFSVEAGKQALENAAWPGRLQIVQRNADKYVFCCAHNMHSLQSDLEVLKVLREKDILSKNTGVIFAVTRNRPAQQHLQMISKIFPNIVVTAANAQHPIPQELQQQNYAIANEFGDAVRVLQKQGIHDYLIIGSIYLVGEAYKYLELEVRS